MTVTNNADSGAGSLREAMANVCANGTITFDGDYVIRLGSQLTIGKNMTIDGTGRSVTLSGDNIIYTWGLGDGSTATGDRITHTYGRAGSYTAVVTASNGTSAVTATTRVVVNPRRVFIPLAMRDYVVAPDLVVQRLIATSNNVQVVLQNQGNAPVLDEFWVDVYINPTTAPTHVNQVWFQLGTQGLVWGVTSSALPALTPGGVLTLTLGDDYFRPGLSAASWPLPAGTPVYAQADSVNLDSTYGGVLENHEISGGPYDNISRTVSTLGPSGVTGPSSVNGGSAPAAGRLPRRP